MSDDLVKRLRICAAFDPDQAEAADRIEQLEAALRYWEQAFATGRSEPLYVARDNGRAALAGEKKND